MHPALQEWVNEYQTEERRQEIEMGRYAKETGSDFQQAPEGTHVARCIKLIDIGTQRGEYKGKPTVRNQFICQWELPGETFEVDGQHLPFVVSRFYTNDLYEKSNLYKDLVAWRGRDFTPEEKAQFDLMNVLGKPCLVTITHNDDGKAKVTGVTKLVKGMDCPPQINESDSFWIDEWDDNKFHALSDGIRGLIEKSDEYKAFAGKTTTKTVEVVEDDIPF